jgi:hypothetical protein
MMMPVQATPVLRGVSQVRDEEAVEPSGCSLGKKILCGAAIAACGTACVITGGAACIQCLATIGASGCIDCF